MIVSTATSASLSVPTGIDIRDGLQMECVNCTQCIDACDDVMHRIGLPEGLIRYSSQDSIAGKAKKLFRARTIVYPLILTGLCIGLLTTLIIKSGFDARIMRGKGAPFTVFGAGKVSNEFQLRLVNRTDEQQQYTVMEPDAEGVEIEVMDQEKMTLPGGDMTLVPLHVTFPSSMTRGDGRETLTITIQDEAERTREISFYLLGPR